jgi:hypothetical protein
VLHAVARVLASQTAIRHGCKCLARDKHSSLLYRCKNAYNGTHQLLISSRFNGRGTLKLKTGGAGFALSKKIKAQLSHYTYIRMLWSNEGILN